MAEDRRNNNGRIGVSNIQTTDRQEIEAFDKLPRNIREIISLASYRVSAVAILNEPRWSDAETLLRSLKQGTQANIIAAYGPDHPQAKDVQ